MDDKQLLDAIRGIVQEETSRIVDEKFKKNNDDIFRGVNVIVENGYKRIENLLREDYSRIEGNAAKGAAVAESHQQIKSTVADHESALKDHNERIQALEKKAI